MKDDEFLNSTSKGVFRLRSQDYMAAVREHPCLVCYSPETQAHHLQRIDNSKGLGLKTGDQWTVPLCFRCHERLHARGNENLFWAVEGVDARGWAVRHYESWKAR